MKKNYLFKALMAVLCFMGMANPVFAVNVSDLVGRYSLVSNGSENNGENGLAVNFDVTIRSGAEDDALILSGFFGKSNTINATFDAENSTIVIKSGNYVEMGVSLEEGSMAAFQLLFPVVDGAPDMMNPITLDVAQDGTISFSNHIGCVVQAFVPGAGFQMMVLETLKGGTLTKKNVQVCTPEQITGKYAFACEKEFNEACTESLLNGFSKGNDELTVKSLGDNQYEISGFFGVSTPVPAVYYPEIGQMIVASNAMLGGVKYGENAEGSLDLRTMLTDMYIDVEEGKLATNNVVMVGFTANDESMEDDAILVLMRGGKGTRTASGIDVVKKNDAAEGLVDVYSLNGVQLLKNAEAGKLNLPKGTYILRSANGVSKVAL